ncbi:MAG: ATP-binding protein [Candidatus Omnitrophota bacterium]
MYIHRDLEKKIIKYLDSPEILAIIGPRQSGKTTLIKNVLKTLKNAVYIDFEDREVLELFNSDIKSFYKLYVKDSKYLFVDEFQYAKEGGKKLKYLYDTFKLKIIISGSSSLDLTKQAIKYLVGRVFVFYLYPFSFKEYLDFRDKSCYENIYLDIHETVKEYFLYKKKSIPLISPEMIKKINKYYHEYAIFGGYPRVVLAKGIEEKITVLKNIYNTYFLREIRDILQLSTEVELQKLIKCLALQTGSIVSYKELSQTTSLNYNNLLKHLNILENTFVIKKLLPFFRNKRTEIAKAPKIYFVDNGLRNMSVGNFQDMGERVDRGSINENFIAGELLKQEFAINYWRTKSNAEVDFILEKQGKHSAIEVKSRLSSDKIGRALIAFKEKYPDFRITIVSENYYSFNKKEQVFFLPLFFV